METKYWLQTRAPAGNWVDNLGATKARCIEQGEWLVAQGHNIARDVRVIQRTDTVVHYV